MAADMPVKAKAPPPPPPVYDWSGAYVGFSIGGVWYDVDRYYPNLGLVALPATTYTSSSDDVIYDFHAGWQYQWGQVILGVEAGYSAGFKEMRSTVALPNPPFADNGAAGLTAEHKITNLFTVGPRLGFAWDRWMIYGTGGYAAATLKAQYLSTATGLTVLPAQSGATWNDGWFAGVGVEYMVHKGALVDVVFGAEYQHFDVSSDRAFCFVGGCAAANFRDYDLGATGDIVRARLTIKTQGWKIF